MALITEWSSTRPISMGHGQCPVKRYNHQLRDLIIRGKVQLSLIVSHELPLEAAADSYKELRPARGRLDQGPPQARTPGGLTTCSGANSATAPLPGRPGSPR